MVNCSQTRIICANVDENERCSMDLMGFRFLPWQVAYHLVDPELLQHVGMCQLSFRVCHG